MILPLLKKKHEYMPLFHLLELQRMYKAYLKALLRERDLERNDYLQHQLRTLAKLIRGKQKER